MKSNCAKPKAVPVRACEMEARSETEHRTKVNPCAGTTEWVSVPANATPDFQSYPYGNGGGGAVKFLCLTLGDLCKSGATGRNGRETAPMLAEKSDRPIVATKPVNAGGAKGATT